MSVDYIVSTVPTYSKQLLDIQSRIDKVEQKLKNIDVSSYESAFITDIFVNQIKATNNITQMYEFLEYDLADTNSVEIPSDDEETTSVSVPKKIFPKIDAVFSEIDNNLRRVEDATETIVTNNNIIGSNANLLRTSVASTSNSASFFSYLKANQNNLTIISSNNLLY